MVGIVRSTYGARAGSIRGSIAHTTTSASTAPDAVATATARPSRTTMSVASTSSATVTPRVAIRSVSAEVSDAIPPVIVHAPNRCSR